MKIYFGVMAVTYIWKLDTNLYSTIVDPARLDEDSSLEELAGGIFETLPTEEEIEKIREFCEETFFDEEAGLENYRLCFDIMLSKVQEINPCISLKSADAYFNVSNDCGELKGEPAKFGVISATIISDSTIKEYGFSATTSEPYDDNKYDIGLTLEIPPTEGLYNPNSDIIAEQGGTVLADTGLTMPKTVGGIEAGTSLGDLSGKCFSEIFNDMFFPELFPLAATKPSITLGNLTITPNVIKLGDDTPEFNNPKVTVNKGYFSGNGYTINEAIYTSGMTTTNMPIINITGIGEYSFTASASYTYSAPTNVPKTSRNNDYTAATATWVAGTASTSKSATLYVVNPIKLNVSNNETITGKTEVLFSGKTYEFELTGVSQDLEITVPRYSFANGGKIEIWNDITQSWALQEAGTTKQYMLTLNAGSSPQTVTITFNPNMTIKTRYRITLANELWK